MYKYYLGLKYLLSRRINLLGVIGVMVGVWALVLVISIFSGFIREVRAHIRGAASDVAYVSLWFKGWEDERGRASSPPSYEAVEQIVLADPNVAGCAPRLLSFGLIFSGTPRRVHGQDVQVLDQDPLSHNVIQVIGIDPAKEATVTEFSKWLSNVHEESLRVANPAEPFKVPRHLIGGWNGGGVPPEARLSDPGILLGEDRVTLRSQIGPVVVGSLIKLAIAQQTGAEQVGLTSRDFTLAGTFSTRHATFDRQNVLVHIDVLRSLMGHDPQSEPYVDVFSEAAIALKDYGQARQTVGRLEDALDRKLGRERGPFFTWEDRNRTFLNAVDHERALMKLVLFVIMVVAGFLIFATLSMMVTEKTRDIGILTAMGATRRGILAIFLICGAFIGLSGCVLGLVAGYLSSIHLNDVNQWVKRQFDVELFPTDIYKLREVPYALDPVWMGQVAIVAMALALLFALIPAWRAARFDPVEALRYE